jgi:UDP-glucose 4-epimerase
MRTALITGGLGFIGYHLSRRLIVEGFRVVALDNLQRGRVDADLARLQADGGYELLIADLLADDIPTGIHRDITHVFHLAAIVGVKNVVGDPYRVLRENALTLMRILGWSRDLPNLQRFVFASTSEIYAGTLEAFGLPIPTSETAPLTVTGLERPRTTYMLSKLYGEALCLHAGLPFTILRPHNVYGPRMGMAHVVPELLRRADEAEPGGKLVVYSPGHRRTFCYISDAIELMVRLALAPSACGMTFNIGADVDEIPILDLADRVAKTVGKMLHLMPGPDTDGSPTRRKPDLARAIKASSYAPRVSLDDGLKRTWDWYRVAIAEAAMIADVSA